MGLLLLYDGVPVPPEGSLEKMKSPEARKEFKDGNRGVLAFHTTPFSGVWAPPLSAYRQATLLASDLMVRFLPHPCYQFVETNSCLLSQHQRSHDSMCLPSSEFRDYPKRRRT